MKQLNNKEQKMPALNRRFNLDELAGSVGASGVTPPAALAAGNEQSGKMARKTKRTDGKAEN